MQHDRSDTHDTNKLRTISRYVFFGFVAVAGYFLLMEHRAHVIPFLPLLLLGACLLMHMFHHGAHNHGSEKDSERRLPPDSTTPPSTRAGPHRH